MGTYIAYVVAAFIAAVVLSANTDRKYLGFTLTFWILAQPVLNYKFSLTVPGLHFDLQPNRLLLLALLPYLFLAGMVGNKSTRQQNTFSTPIPYEKYFYIYLALTIVSLAYNFGQIRPQNLVVVPSAVINFIIVYLVAKKWMTQAVFEAIIKAIVLLAVTCSFIAIYQVVVNSEFLKTCDPRPAFGNIVRASGIFQAEYELGYFQILAIIISLVRYKGSLLRIIIIPLLTLSVLLTFHRLDLIILLVSLIIYTWLFSNTTRKAVIVFGIVFMAFFTFVSYTVLVPLFHKSAFVTERLDADTVSGRFKQYKVVATALPKFPMGVGDYENQAYTVLMAKHPELMESIDAGTWNWHQIPYRVHNGYLEVGILHGPLAMIVFIAMMFSMLWYFKKRISRESSYSMVPFFAVLIWLLSNVSNGVSNFAVYYAVLLSMLSGAVVALNKKAVAIEKTSTVAPKIMKASVNVSHITKAIR